MLHSLEGLTDEDWAKFAKEEPEEFERLLTQLQADHREAKKYTRLEDYKPYPWQRDFHAHGAIFTERMLMAANRCITPWTTIETVPQPDRILEFLDATSFDVASWDGECRYVERASGVFLRGIEPAFRLLLGNGQEFDCSRRHRVLTSGGWLSVDQLVQLSGGLRWSQTPEDYRANCGAGDHLYGQRLRAVPNTAEERLPSRGGVRKHAPSTFSREGVAEHISQHSHAYPGLDLHATLDDPDQIAVLCALFEDPGLYTAALQRSATHQAILRFLSECDGAGDLVGGTHRPSLGQFSGAESEFAAVADNSEDSALVHLSGRQSVSPYTAGQADLEWSDDEPCTEIFYPCEHPELVGGAKIVAVLPLGFQPILDFTVENSSCYWAGGAIHHNTGKTEAGAAETTIHLTGLYPEIGKKCYGPDHPATKAGMVHQDDDCWPKGWVGKRFEDAILAWTGSPTNETSKDIVQNALLGSDLGEALGTGFVPKDLIVGKPNTRQAGVKDVVDSFKVRHVTGGLSKCVLKTYEQGWKKWQGTAPQVVWDDEEPDEYKIFSESQTRVLSSRGIVMVTFTPLSGQTELVSHFQEHAGSLCYLKGATWDDAPHLDEKAKNDLKSLYRAHEVDARTKGIPMLGAGAIFPVPEETIKIDPIEIPPHWRRIKGIDFGTYHFQATADCAWDGHTDTFYITAIYKAKGQTALPHAMQINASNQWIPVAWPHDGENKDKGVGTKLVEHYRKHGCNMLAKSACYPKGKLDKREKLGSQPVQPVIDDMLERMMTGRLKVFSTCVGWFEEYRSYHRNEKGEIVARNDDALKASFYALMMVRYAKSWNEYTRSFHNVVTLPTGLSTAV